MKEKYLKPGKPNQATTQNTDKELWRKNDDYYSPSIHVTQDDSIGINVGGVVIIKSVGDWHKLATNGGWNNARISPPKKSGRYWCVVAEQTHLGLSHYEWNCHYDLKENNWSDGLKYKNVVHWMPLMGFPFILSSPH